MYVFHEIRFVRNKQSTTTTFFSSNPKGHNIYNMFCNNNKITSWKIDGSNEKWYENGGNYFASGEIGNFTLFREYLWNPLKSN